MKRIWLNKVYIAKLTTQWTMAAFSLLGLIGMFVSLSDILDSTLKFGQRLMISVGILIASWLLIFCICSYYVYKKRRIDIFEVNKGHHVYVQYGDVFSEEEVLKARERRNIVIPVNRCFDTLVDDDLISSKTLHGLSMKKIYDTGVYDQDSLNKKIQENLKRQLLVPENIEKKDKRSGNLKRYPVGSVAEITVDCRRTFFFLGLSSFDKNLKATTTDDEYVLALMRLIEFCYQRSQGYPVVIPLIGAGLSRTKKTERDILEYMVTLLKLNKELINCDVHIIVRETGKDTIAIMDL